MYVNVIWHDTYRKISYLLFLFHKINYFGFNCKRSDNESSFIWSAYNKLVEQFQAFNLWMQKMTYTWETEQHANTERTGTRNCNQWRQNLTFVHDSMLSMEMLWRNIPCLCSFRLLTANCSNAVCKVQHTHTQISIIQKHHSTLVAVTEQWPYNNVL